MPTSNRSDFRHWSRQVSATDRIAVYGPVCTVVWQGSVGDCCPYADQVGIPENELLKPSRVYRSDGSQLKSRLISPYLADTSGRPVTGIGSLPKFGRIDSK